VSIKPYLIGKNGESVLMRDKPGSRAADPDRVLADLCDHYGADIDEIMGRGTLSPAVRDHRIAVTGIMASRYGFADDQIEVAMDADVGSVVSRRLVCAARYPGLKYGGAA